MLKNCYLSCLQLADQQLAGKHEVKSISFPNISTGVYGFPNNKAAAIAIDTVQNYFDAVSSAINQLNFVCFDEDNYIIYH